MCHLIRARTYVLHKWPPMKVIATTQQDLLTQLVLYFIFNFTWVVFHGTENSQDSKEREVTTFIFRYHFHWGIYLLLGIWDVHLLFLIAGHVITRLLLDEIFPPQEIRIWLTVELHFDCWCNVTYYQFVID